MDICRFRNAWYFKSKLVFLQKISSHSLVFLLIGIILIIPAITSAQDTTAVAPNGTLPDSSVVRKMEAGDLADIETPRRQLVKFNEYKGPYFSVRVGGGLLYDFGTYKQDAESKEQVTDLEKDIKFRDGRFVFKGRL